MPGIKPGMTTMRAPLFDIVDRKNARGHGSFFLLVGSK
jgi:hypothetical protein